MKRYLLFAGIDCYPLGGWDDLVGDFATVKDAEKKIDDIKKYLEGPKEPAEWFHLVDTKTNKIIQSME